MDFTIEELSMNAWPAIKTILYDGWVIRLAGGYSNRANSVNPIYPSKIKPEEKFAYCDKLFARYGLPATYKLAGCEEHKTIDKKLECLNYNMINETSLQTRAVPSPPQNNYKGVIVSDDFTEGWINSVVQFNKIETRHISAFKKITGNIAGRKIVVRKEIDNEIVGCGFGALENGYVGVFDIVVKEKFRGKGYGSEIVKTILSGAAARGVKKSYLQVMIANPAALRLYEKLGYREMYRYWYRKKSDK